MVIVIFSSVLKSGLMEDRIASLDNQLFFKTIKI